MVHFAGFYLPRMKAGSVSFVEPNVRLHKNQYEAMRHLALTPHPYEDRLNRRRVRRVPVVAEVQVDWRSKHTTSNSFDGLRVSKHLRIVTRYFPEPEEMNAILYEKKMLELMDMPVVAGVDMAVPGLEVTTVYSAETGAQGTIVLTPAVPGKRTLVDANGVQYTVIDAPKNVSMGLTPRGLEARLRDELLSDFQSWRAKSSRGRLEREEERKKWRRDGQGRV